MKYIRTFQTNSDFENAYEGEEYIEPWVSLTKEGDCEYVTALYEGDEYDLYYVGKNANMDVYYEFLAGSKGTIESVTIDPSTGDVTAITVNSTVYIYQRSNQSEYPHIWKENGSSMQIFTKDRNPSSGNSCFIQDEDDVYVVSEKRNPEVGDVIEYQGISVEVVSVGQGQQINRVNYNKELQPIIDFTPTGNSYTYADFRVTPEMVSKWIEMAENHEPYENFRVKVMSEEIDEYVIYRGVNDAITGVGFRHNLSGLSMYYEALISVNRDLIEVIYYNGEMK